MYLWGVLEEQELGGSSLGGHLGAKLGSAWKFWIWMTIAKTRAYAVERLTWIFFPRRSEFATELNGSHSLYTVITRGTLLEQKAEYLEKNLEVWGYPIGFRRSRVEPGRNPRVEMDIGGGDTRISDRRDEKQRPTMAFLEMYGE